jgi:hypothetical protein
MAGQTDIEGNMELGFYQHVNVRPRATQMCLESVRRFYPDSPIVVSCDNGHDFTDVCRSVGAVYQHNKVALGYPTNFGWDKARIIEWLDRMYKGVSLLHTDFFMMLEDDIILLKRITIDKDWEVAGQVLMYENQVPRFNEAFMEILRSFSGVRPGGTWYSTGGGSIFKTRTFVDNFMRVRCFLMSNFDHIQQNVYKTIGWMDCMMTIFYLLCGKPLHQNTRLYNNFPCVTPFDISTLGNDIEILHNYKDFY